MPAEYAPHEIEPKWQAHWDAHKTFRAPNPGEPGFDPARPKRYILDFFPYPSGSGLHVGHPEGYTATDIFARYRRMRGDNVLHTMGWDAFGLPAEQHAIETGQHPAETTRRNIDTFRRQLKQLGFSFDWDREFATTDPSYYKWTQWIFLKLFNSWYDEQAGKARPVSELPIPPEVSARGERAVREYVDARRLAYLADVPVNWCPALGTVLANEEVTNEGRSERGNHPVYRRPLRQWMLRITKYADRLERDLAEVDWPESVKLMQRNWIGRSEGAVVRFRIDGLESDQSRAPDQSRDRKGAVGGMRNGGEVGSRKSEVGTRNDQIRDRDGVVVSEQCAGASDKWGCEKGISHRQIDGDDGVIEVFTTRPDTLFGATYMVLAPEHPLVERITTAEHRDAVGRYAEQAAQRTELDRTADAKRKTGVFTGAYAVNPVNDEKIPVWVADYVLMGYGTGAIMAVPGHDERDFEFAKQFELPIRAVVRPPMSWIQDRIVQNRIDVDHAKRRGRQDVAEQLMRSAAMAATTVSGITFENTQAFLDGDPGWLAQVALPAYEEDPGLFVDAFTGDGTAVHSGRFDGSSTAEFKKRITAWLEERGVGRGTVNYKLRDWLFSRQRYWGEPFPILHGPDGQIMPLDESELPLELPAIDDFRPTTRADDQDDVPEPPLGRATDWVTVQRGGKAYRRELNTMPQWAGSCWYYLRFLDPKNESQFCSREVERYWMTSKRKNGELHAGGVDLYLGGAEHAVLHLLYARFWHKVLYDLGYVSTPEPFGKLFNQGMIRAYAYRDGRGTYVSYDEIEFTDDEATRRSDGEKLSRAVEKMSKSLKNVINPEDTVHDYGADSLRLYEMFMGPLEASKPWNPRDVPGVYRFCQKCWRLIVDEKTGELSRLVHDGEADGELERALHKTIRKVGDDIERLAFNTAISAMMEFVNQAHRAGRIHRGQAERFTLILAPFAPHLAEELWQRLRGDRWTGSLAHEPWPQADAGLLVDEQVEIAVQINGKVAGRVTVPRDADEAAVRAAALAEPRIAERAAGKQVVKTIFVPGRMMSLVVR